MQLPTLRIAKKGATPVALAVLVACGTSSAGSARGSGAITAEELRTVSVTDCLEAVRTLRPQWLRVRAAPTPKDPDPQRAVILDGRPRGELIELSFIHVSDVESIRLVSSSDATTRFGTGFTNGAIESTLR